MALIPTDNEARAFVERRHYEHSYPAARMRVGLHWSGELVGVAVFSQPPSQAVLPGASLPLLREMAATVADLVERLALPAARRFLELDDEATHAAHRALARAGGANEGD